MPYEKAVQLIEDSLGSTTAGIDHQCKENAKKIAKLVYDVYPAMDETPGLDFKIETRENHIYLVFTNDVGIFEFTCKNNNGLHYYQSLWGDNAPYWDEDHKNFPTSRVISRHLKRKRVPLEKMAK